MRTFEVQMHAMQLVYCSLTVQAEDEDAARATALEEASELSSWEWEGQGGVEDIEVDTLEEIDNDECCDDAE